MANPNWGKTIIYYDSVTTSILGACPGENCFQTDEQENPMQWDELIANMPNLAWAALDEVPALDPNEVNAFQVKVNAFVGGEVVAKEPTTLTSETEAIAWTMIRQQRNARLAASDWTHVVDSPLDTPTTDTWAAHRQALRDLPAGISDPTAEVTWPTEPGA